MRAAEGREKIVKRDFIRQVLDPHRGCNARSALRVQQIVAADSHIEKSSGFHAVGVVIVVSLARLRQGQQC